MDGGGEVVVEEEGGECGGGISHLKFLLCFSMADRSFAALGPLSSQVSFASLCFFLFVHFFFWSVCFAPGAQVFWATANKKNKKKTTPDRIFLGHSLKHSSFTLAVLSALSFFEGFVKKLSSGCGVVV